MSTAFQICPECGSGKIEMGDLVGQDLKAKCLACGWEGAHRDLMAAVGSEEDVMKGSQELFGTPDINLGIAQEVSKAYLHLLSQTAAQPIGLAMIQAGVIGAQQPKELTRLIRAATLAAHKATLEEIEAIQKEIQDGRQPEN